MISVTRTDDNEAICQHICPVCREVLECLSYTLSRCHCCRREWESTLNFHDCLDALTEIIDREMPEWFA